MKNLLIVLFCAFGMIAYAQNDPVKDPMQQEKATEDGPIMTFETTTVDFGEIDRGSDPFRTVEFTNTGNQPLIVKHAKGSCGCTVPTWPKEPIMPGESAEIKVRYDTKRIGVIRKTVKITTNEGGDPHVLQVTGKVLTTAEEPSLPEKKSNLSGGGR